MKFSKHGSVAHSKTMKCNKHGIVAAPRIMKFSKHVIVLAPHAFSVQSVTLRMLRNLFLSILFTYCTHKKFHGLCYELPYALLLRLYVP